MNELNELGELLVDEMAKYLLARGKVSSGSLIDSLEYKIEDSATRGVELSIYAASHAKFVNKGRKKLVKKVPIDSLIKWIEQKGLETGDKKKRNLAFAIQRHIWKNGIQPVQFIDDVIANNNLNILRKVGDYYITFVGSEIDKLFTKYWTDKEIVL